MSNQKVTRLIEELKDLKVSEFLQVIKHFVGEISTNPLPCPDDGGVPIETEEFLFDVILKSAGAAKLTVIKVVKDVTDLPLKESKDLVDKAPVAILVRVSREQANDVRAKLSEAGADVEIV